MYLCIWALSPVFVWLTQMVCLTPPPASTFILCFLCARHYSKHFIYCLSLVGALNPHFTDEELASERLRNLAKFTPLVNSRAGMWTSGQLPSPCFITVRQRCSTVSGAPPHRPPAPTNEWAVVHTRTHATTASKIWGLEWFVARLWTRATVHPRGRGRERGRFNSRLRLLRD